MNIVTRPGEIFLNHLAREFRDQGSNEGEGVFHQNAYCTGEASSGQGFDLVFFLDVHSGLLLLPPLISTHTSGARRAGRYLYHSWRIA